MNTYVEVLTCSICNGKADAVAVKGHETHPACSIHGDSIVAKKVSVS